MNSSASDIKSRQVFDCQPLRAWRYNTDKLVISDVIAPPYDVISPEKQQGFYDRSPYNVIRLILNKKEAADNDQNNGYVRARNFLNDWQRSGVLIREEEPCFYVYRQTFKDPVSGQTKNRSALLGRVRLQPFENGVIVPHEKTLRGPKEDRMKLIRMVKTNLSPIFGLYRDEGFEVRGIIQDPLNSRSIFQATDDDGIVHSLLAVSDPDIVTRLHKVMLPKKIYIADGHHRYETSLEYAKQTRLESGVSEKVIMPYDYIYMALVSFDDPGFIVLPTHRIVSDLGMDDRTAIRKLQEFFKVEPSTVAGLEKITAGYDDGGTTYGLMLRDEKAFILKMIDKEKTKACIAQQKPDIWYDLNVNILGHLIFSKIFGIPEARWESILKFEHTVGGAVEPVQKGTAQAAFFLKPPKVEMLEKMGAVNERMPQKSTYFYPKLASGLIFYSHEE
ncbi:MAG: hypothetical protein BWY42_00048 [Candidatus Omnitrophica bacterium ADurb.Bin277]|nr:MAG: hypothetical protein BWY42_00048 [Candidatus Omnitrophica bacterium ADurb.Bin277]